ncbi:histidine kinase [Aliiglaciecola sp. CAU 1673]|uniref:histidine kinase n=1 Tax=Aliiglaciecola sp. CAU 1673 TaxID=3032595 RepID=UPI0023DB84B1|nr:histidine kinase [Aliiglaciecola sp. CAU 1673]MDF2177407.1 histidine kinase [Aliiglaciecola sp. CAU 1673]
MFSRFNRSIVFRIGLMMFAISLLAVVSMTSALFISDRAESDAYAINLSGSLRMLSYQMVNTLQRTDIPDSDKRQLLESLMLEFEKKLNLPLIRRTTADHPGSEAHGLYQTVLDNWQQQIKPVIWQGLTASGNVAALQTQIDRQVRDVDTLVRYYQRHAEDNVAAIRLIISIALLLTAVLTIVALFTVNQHIKQPLAQLTQIALQIGRGDFTGRADEGGKDELALLGHTLNRMSDALSKSHAHMEQKVREKTAKLNQSNQSIELLYNISKSLQDTDSGPQDFEPMLQSLAHITGIRDLDLCVMTASGNKPYEHLMTCDKVLPSQCLETDCSGCVDGDTRQGNKLSFPLTRGDLNFGVLTCQLAPGQPLLEWQQRLFNSVAEQIAVSLSLREQQEQSRRLALMHERTVIARELHDSLAQALSYLKIQVARLQKLLDNSEQEAKVAPIIDELKTGLNSAYRELRELLTTFRLKMDGQGLHSAMQSSLNQLQSRTEQMRFHLEFKVENLPFSPNEEIHLLQITREAAQNALHHSQANSVTVRLAPDLQHPQRLQLSIRDNGIGIGKDPGKLNHYGLAIMQERSRNLGGALKVTPHPEGGTLVSFDFEPEYYRQRKIAV